MESKIFDIIERNYKQLSHLSGYERSVFDKILHCRSEAVPFMYTHCDTCSAVHPVYKSCKDRMCPICNKSASLKWVAKRESELLQTGYFLLTYTVPSELRSLFLLNKKECYDLLFKAMNRSLREGIRNNERTFHGEGGYFAMLHTWDQRLLYHPHLHVVVPAGCISDDGTEWIHSHPSFFLPVKRMSVDFRKKFMFYLNKELRKGSLKMPKEIDDPVVYYKKLETRPWVVHSQPPEKGRNKPEQIVRYLSRYVAKSAVSDRRIHAVKNGIVHLNYFDRKQKKCKTEKIHEMQFLNRLVMHILPKGFKKVRFYGFMANRYRASYRALCRLLLGEPLSEQDETERVLLNDTAFLFWKYFKIDITLCKDCGKGHVQIINGRAASGSG